MALTDVLLVPLARERRLLELLAAVDGVEETKVVCVLLKVEDVQSFPLVDRERKEAWCVDEKAQALDLEVVDVVVVVVLKFALIAALML